MRKLKTILLSNVFLFVLLLLGLVVCFVTISKPGNIEWDLTDTEVFGVVQKIENYSLGKEIVILVEDRGKLRIFLECENKIEIRIGDVVLFKGNFLVPSNNTIPNAFNFSYYLWTMNERVYFQSSEFQVIGKTNNLFLLFKRFIYDEVQKRENAAYLSLFLLGDSSLLDEDISNSFQSNGISHLFSISGMHFSFLINFFYNLFPKKKSFLNFILLNLLLIGYLSLIGFIPSALRAFLLFEFRTISDFLSLNWSRIRCFIYVIIVFLFLSPFSFFNIGFQFSAVISFFICWKGNIFSKYSKIIQSLLFSVFTFIVSLPISLYYFYEVNFLGIILNLFFIPIVTNFLFPVEIISFFLPFFSNFLCIIEGLFSSISLFFSNVDFLVISFSKPTFLWIFMYYLGIIIIFYKQNNLFYLYVFLCLIFLYNVNLLIPKTYFLVIDVGQGDSLLFHSNNKTLLLDTGGYYYEEVENGIYKKKLEPLFKSLGIRKLDVLCLSHGDYDHMGEAINLVNNFKVEKLIFNCGESNKFEQDLIKVLDKKKILYYSCIKELNIHNNKLYFLNDKDYGNENDNSSVIYTELNDNKFLFMGDAGVEVEEDLIEKYNLQNIDVLKVGHHGSKTSSSEEFINEINPKYSIISVGKNNRYGHPNKEVLSILDKSKIYRTDQDGSIMFKIKKDKLKIETWAP